VAKFVNEDDDRVILFWRLLIREDKDVPLWINDTSLVLCKQINHLLNDPSSRVTSVQIRYLAHYDDIIKLVLRMRTCSLLEDLVEELFRHACISTEEVQEVRQVQQGGRPFWQLESLKQVLAGSVLERSLGRH